MRPPREWLLNEVVNRIPSIDARMRAYERLGVVMDGRAAVMLHTEIWAPKLLRLGTGATVGRHVLLDARGGITIGRHVNITSYARLETAKHLVDDPDFGHSYDPIVVGDRAWVALGATVLGGVTIGEGAVVSAGAVVTTDVEPFTIVGGVPAVPIRKRNPDLRYELDWRPNWL